MEMSGQLNDPAALLPADESLVLGGWVKMLTMSGVGLPAASLEKSSPSVERIV
jgi:hypothetical protein